MNFTERFLQNKILLYCAVFLLALKIFTIAVLVNFPANVFFADITRIALVNFVNQGREAAGLESLLENEKLNQAAYLKAENMVQNQYFNHTSPLGVTPWRWFLQSGYDYRYAGENLAVGFYDSEEVFNAWLASPSHRQNLLNPKYTEVGTAVLGGFGENNTVVVVQLFGSQKISVTKNTNSLKINNFSNNVEKPAASPESPEGKNEPDEPGLIIDSESGRALNTAFTRMILGTEKSAGRNDAFSKFLNYILYSYEGLFKEVIYGISLVVIGILSVAIIFSGAAVNKNFIFRSVIILTILFAAALLDKEAVISIIPHKLLI